MSTIIKVNAILAIAVGAAFALGCFGSEPEPEPTPTPTHTPLPTAAPTPTVSNPLPTKESVNRAALSDEAMIDAVIVCYEKHPAMLDVAIYSINQNFLRMGLNQRVETLEDIRHWIEFLFDEDPELGRTALEQTLFQCDFRTGLQGN